MTWGKKLKWHGEKSLSDIWQTRFFYINVISERSRQFSPILFGTLIEIYLMNEKNRFFFHRLTLVARERGRERDILNYEIPPKIFNRRKTLFFGTLSYFWYNHWILRWILIYNFFRACYTLSSPLPTEAREINIALYCISRTFTHITWKTQHPHFTSFSTLWAVLDAIIELYDEFWTIKYFLESPLPTR